jgi:hypothetical protein
MAALTIVSLVAVAVGLPSAATAAVDTPFTFDQPAAATSGVVQYPSTGATVTTLTGTGPDGATVRIETIDSGTLAFGYPCTTTVAAGAWSCDVTFGSFVGTVGAQRMEETGGLLLPTETISRNVVALTPPTFNPASTSVISSSTEPTITGTVTPLGGTTGATVRLTVEGDEVCIATVAPAGTWTCSISIAGALDGPLDLAVTQTRSAGGISGTSLAATTTYTLDTVGPSIGAAFTTPAGSTLTVSQAAFALAGVAEAGATVRVRAGSTTLCGPVTASVSGTWACSATTPADGNYTMRIVQRDAAGNLASVISETIALTVKRSNVIVLPPIPIIPPPPVFITPPNINITAPTQPIVITGEPIFLIDVSTPLSDPAPREELQQLVVQSLEQFTNSTMPQGEPISVTIQLNTRQVFGSGGGSEIIGDWDDLDARHVAFLFVLSEPRLIDSAPITGDGTVTFEGQIPTDLEPGEHELKIVIEAEGQPDVEPIEVSVPIAVEIAEPIEPISAETGVSPWLWIGLGALGIGVIALVVVMARNARRRV